MLVEAANSEHVGPIIAKLTEAGYPEDVASLEVLTPVERGRFRQWQIAQQTHWDNMYYQYQQGFLDEEYYRDEFEVRVRRLAPIWRALGITGNRRSFAREIERLLGESDRHDADGAQALVREACATLAELRGWTADEAARRTHANAREVCDLARADGDS